MAAEASKNGGGIGSCFAGRSGTRTVANLELVAAAAERYRPHDQNVAALVLNPGEFAESRGLLTPLTRRPSKRKV